MIENVYTPIQDSDIRKDISSSIIWKKAFKLEEITEEVKKLYPKWYVYKIKFNNTTPIQVMKFSIMK